MGRRSERPTCGIVAAAVAAALAACALLLPSCASGEATVLPLAGGEAAVSEDGAASEAESGGATEAKASDDPEDPGDAEASAADLDEADEGASPEGLEPTGDELAARMDAYLAANFPRAGAPGLAVAVVDAGGVRYLRTFGDCPDADAPFVVGSLSKSFTAVAVMQLVEQGAVDLDAPASRYAPGYDVPDEVTVRSLLNQTSGFGAYDSLAEAADGELGETFGAFSYANANYDLLGRVVEGASGEDYARYLDEHVLEPLGMASTTADPARAEALGMVPGHRDWFGLPVADGFRHAQGDGAWGGPASGYVASSVRDMASYLRMRGISVSTGTNACPLLRQPRNPAIIHADLWPSTTAGCRFSVRAAKAAAMRSEASHSSAYVVVRPFGALWAGACGCSRTCCSTARKNSFSLLMLILPQLPLSNGKNLRRISQ